MSELRRAAVLVPLWRPAAGEPLRIGFVTRSPASTTHAGHVGFPGGKVEPVDGSLRETARRETVEETDLDAGDVVLGEPIDPHYTRSGDFVVTPFPGNVRTPDRFVAGSREVTDTFWAAVPDLRRAYEMDGDRIRYPLPDAPAEIWGVTGRIVTTLLVRGVDRDVP